MQHFKDMNKQTIQQKKIVRKGMPGCFRKIEQAGSFMAKMPALQALPVKYLTKNVKMAMKAMTMKHTY